MLGALLVGCRTDPSAGEALAGTWAIDEDTQAWLPRSCVQLDFDAPAAGPTFVVERRGDQLAVVLGDRQGTTFLGALQDGVFDGRQIILTSPTGRFCGAETVVRLRLDYRRAGPGELVGAWSTPDCDTCPDRRFGARRVEP